MKKTKWLAVLVAVFHLASFFNLETEWVAAAFAVGIAFMALSE